MDRKRLDLFILERFAQGSNHKSIIIIGEIWNKIVTLMHSTIHKEQVQTKNRGREMWKGRKQTSKNSRKVANQFPSFRPSQGILTIPIVCWTSLDRVATTSMLPHTQNRVVSFTQFPYFLEFEYINSGTFRIFNWYIHNPWVVCKLMVTFNCVFTDWTWKCHG